MAAPAVGIDLGTTYSCIAVWKQDLDRAEIIDVGGGERTMPSIVGFAGDKILIGHEALHNLTDRPEQTIAQNKRIMGRLYNDEVVAKYIQRSKVTITKNNSTGKPQYEVMHKKQMKMFSPEQISALVLGRLKQAAEEYLRCKVVDAIITVPAYFGHSQREATRLAAQIAGLNVLRLINEPTSAAYAYSLDDLETATQGDVSLFFDLGGGTFDISVMRLQEEQFEVLSTKGDLQLGGEDFTNNLIDDAKERLRMILGDLSMYQDEVNTLYMRCERAKRNLSYDYKFNSFANTGSCTVALEFTREQFEAQNNSSFKKCIALVDEALKDAKKTKDQVQNVVLIGGSTRIPKVKQLLEEYFDGPDKIECSINPDEAVAKGAAIYAAYISNCDPVPRGIPILQDITALSLGIEVHGEIMSVVVPKNTRIPCSNKHNYTTVYDYQSSVRNAVYQGERQMTKQNQYLGEFTLKNIKIARKGVPKFIVKFEIDESGIITVSSTDQDTGSQNQIELSRDSYTLSQDEIESMIADAKKMQIDDQKEKSRVEARLKLEDTIYQMQNETGKYGNRNRQKQWLIGDIQRWLTKNQQAPEREYLTKQRLLWES